MPRRLPGLLIFCASLAPLAANPARADLYCATPLVDKGEVRGGVPLAHRFTIVNRGPEAVEITDVHPSCGCLAPKLEPRRLAVGESAVLSLDVNTLTQPAGPNNWYVRLHYKTGGEECELPLYLYARIIAEISVEPPALAINFTDAAIGHDITVTDRRTEPLIVRSVEASSPHVRTQLGEMRRDSAGHWVRTIQVQVAADCSEGQHQESLLIRTSDPVYPELKVPFTIVKRSRRQVTAMPEAVNLTEIVGQPLPKRIVQLRAADEQDVRIERIECDPPTISCRWKPGPGHRATLCIRVDRSLIVGESLRGAVHVHLSQPTPQIVTVPVNCLLH